MISITFLRDKGKMLEQQFTKKIYGNGAVEIQGHAMPYPTDEYP